jgi:hypothetical protein
VSSLFIIGGALINFKSSFRRFVPPKQARTIQTFDGQLFAKVLIIYHA